MKTIWIFVEFPKRCLVALFIIKSFEIRWEKKKTIQNRSDAFFSEVTTLKFPSNENLTKITVSRYLKIKLRLNLWTSDKSLGFIEIMQEINKSNTLGNKFTSKNTWITRCHKISLES